MDRLEESEGMEFEEADLDEIMVRVKSGFFWNDADLSVSIAEMKHSPV